MAESGAEWPKVIYVCPSSRSPYTCGCHRDYDEDHGVFEDCQEREVEVVPASVAQELAEALKPFQTDYAEHEDQLNPADLYVLDKATDALSRYRSLVGDKQKEETDG